MKRLFAFILVVSMLFSFSALASSAKECALGDVNGNGDIDVLDYILIKRCYFGTYTLTDGETLPDHEPSVDVDHPLESTEAEAEALRLMQMAKPRLPSSARAV